MKVVIVPDSFKGSASSQEVAQWIENGILSTVPDCETIKIAIGDGGEGTLDAVIGAGLVITGEGKFDSQSLSGKAPIGILEIASQQSVPVALICGQATLNSSDEIVEKFQSISALHSLESDIDTCITQPGPIIEKIAASIAKALTS